MQIRYSKVYDDAYQYVSKRGRFTGPQYVIKMIRTHQKKPLRERRLTLRCLLTAVDTQSIFESVEHDVRRKLVAAVEHADRLADAKLTTLQAQIAHHLWRPDSEMVQSNYNTFVGDLSRAQAAPENCAQGAA